MIKRIKSSIRRIKSSIRELFFRYSVFRTGLGLLSIVVGRTKTLGINHLLSYEEEDAAGPIQRDEAIAIFGLIRTLRPNTIVEFGFYTGHSAFNFLRALGETGRIYSYDVLDECLRRARTELAFADQFTFVHKSQNEFHHSDIDFRPIDFVFFDGAHDLQINIETFQRIRPHLTEQAIIAIHDTGLWVRDYIRKPQSELMEREPSPLKGCWITNDLYSCAIDERKFVNWLISEYDEYGAIHLHSTNTLRHGISLVQKQLTLQTDPNKSLNGRSRS